MRRRKEGSKAMNTKHTYTHTNIYTNKQIHKRTHIHILASQRIPFDFVKMSDYERDEEQGGKGDRDS